MNVDNRRRKRIGLALLSLTALVGTPLALTATSTAVAASLSCPWMDASWSPGQPAGGSHDDGPEGFDAARL